MVSGSELYNIDIELTPLAKPTWKQVKSQCAGRIGSLVDLLQGKLSQDVMSIVTARKRGLFPKPKEIKMKCSCPDYAYLCKHLAAVLYGIGARLDQQPELLFLLRQVDHLELVTAAGERAVATKMRSKKKDIADEVLSEIFGIELEGLSTDQLEASKSPATSPSVKSKDRPNRTQRAASRQATSRASVTRPKQRSDQSQAIKKPKPRTPAKPSKTRAGETPTSSPGKATIRARTTTSHRSKA